MRCRPGASRFYFDSKVNYGARQPPPVSGMDGALCYIHPVMKTRVAFGFYFWFSVLGGREANV
jgi:hypothetical protein